MLAGFLLRHNNVYSASGSINTAPPHVRTKRAPYSKRETIAAQKFIVNPDHRARYNFNCEALSRSASARPTRPNE